MHIGPPPAKQVNIRLGQDIKIRLADETFVSGLVIIIQTEPGCGEETTAADRMDPPAAAVLECGS